MAPRKKVEKTEAEILSKKSSVESELDVSTTKPAEKKTTVKKSVIKKTTEKKPTELKKVSSPEEVLENSTSKPFPESDMVQKPVTLTTNRGALFLGAGLLLMGILLIAGRLLSIPFGDFLWSFIFIIPGTLVFFSALASDSSSGEGLSILGAILTTLGLVFLIQEITGFWASWAYIWALIAPASVGAAQMAYGTRKRRSAITASGKRLFNLGLLLFAVGFVFFELIIGISGFGISNLGLPVFPVMLVFLGVLILVRALTNKR